ncbi:hypothetical protein KBD45_05255 [Candidatus Dojkabacteria bacterium]|nr:hypothetical protein [Candidatus Dojkabacteria bacterium]
MSETPFPLCGLNPGQAMPFNDFSNFPCLRCLYNNPTAMAGKSGFCSTGLVGSALRQSEDGKIVSGTFLIRPFTAETMAWGYGPASKWFSKWGVEIVGKWIQRYNRPE